MGEVRIDLEKKTEIIMAHSNNQNKILTRRAFLTKAAASSVAIPFIVSASALGKAAVPPASERIVMAAIGVGGMGTGDTRALLNDSRIQYVAVCDVQTSYRKHAQKMVNDHYGNKDCTDYNDFREILARKDIDAVNIATPDHWHAVVSTRAAAAGKDVYCQKPLSLTIDQGKKMVKAVKRYGVIFQTGTQQRSDGTFHRACELVRNGRVGKIQEIEVEVPGSMSLPDNPTDPIPEGLDYDMWLGPAPKAPFAFKRIHPFGWRWIFDYAGGCVTDWGAHHIDIAQWALGTTLTGPVEFQGKGVFPTKGMYNTAVSWKYHCKYKNGVKLTCFAKKEFKPGQYPNGIKFTGDKGWLYVNRGSIDANPKSILDEKIGPNEIQLYKSNNHYRNFVDCIISKKPTAAPVEEAHRSVSICHLANIALRLDTKVKWDPDKEIIIDNDQAARMLARPMRHPWRI